MFHQSFLTIMRGLDPIDTIEHYNKTNVRNTNLDLLPKIPETVVKIAPFLMQTMKKQQRLEESCKDYYVATDVQTGVVYICYKSLMMIDIDTKNIPDITDKFIIDHFSAFDDKCFRVFKSGGGYHVFCVSEEFDYRNTETVKFMLDNFVDFYYCVYCYIRGFSVRLNKKFYEHTDTPLYQDMGLCGNTQLVKQSLQELVDKHITLVAKYKETLSMV